MTDQERLVAALDEITATARRIDGHLARIAGALDRLAPAVLLPEPAPCMRCTGQGWLGHPTKLCHACGGTGQQPG